ncbi:MAG: hypothetical protein WCX95_02935 [Candidatus Gracilibacteria bacterium]
MEQGVDAESLREKPFDTSLKAAGRAILKNMEGVDVESLGASDVLKSSYLEGMEPSRYIDARAESLREEPFDTSLKAVGRAILDTLAAQDSVREFVDRLVDAIRVQSGVESVVNCTRVGDHLNHWASDIGIFLEAGSDEDLLAVQKFLHEKKGIDVFLHASSDAGSNGFCSMTVKFDDAGEIFERICGSVPAADVGIRGSEQSGAVGSAESEGVKGVANEVKDAAAEVIGS